MKFETDAGRADFHSLLRTVISNLAESGVDPRRTKELARHSTIALTLESYPHVDLKEIDGAFPFAARHPVGVAVEPTAENLFATIAATDSCNHRSYQKLQSQREVLERAGLSR